LASDSGTASGTSFLEASIHALNELIERDAYSLFLINAFIRKQRHGIRVIDKKTIPDHLQAIVNHIEKTYQDELIIFDITSDLKVPSFFVSMTKQSQLLQPRGCGTSLNREYALERALLESLQPLHIYNEKARKNQQTILANFKETPLLLACAQADVSGLAESGETVHFNTLPGYDKHPSLEQQFHTITQRIKSHGFAVYMQTLASLPTGFTCVRYLIPELERFYMVQTGKYILPAKRGMRLIEQRLD